jgi:selenocysteine-specific elongation factor
MKFVIGGTAGHIDHGKTELMRALTGVYTDRFPEEQERGITIDIGFAPLRLSDDIQIGFIDVPGHEKFVKNMLAGIGGIDFVLLIVAADESVMPQTEEHFNICKLLKIPYGMTVITKCDLTDPEMAEVVAEEVRDLTEGSFLEGAPVIRTSAVTGEGIDALKSELLGFCRDIKPKTPGAYFRLPVDRAFVKKGFGTIITGTVISGSTKKGKPVELLPSRIETAVRGLEVYNESVAVCQAGQRAAVNLQGIEAGQVGRGETVTEKGLFKASYILDVKCRLLSNQKKPYKDYTRIRFHTGTAEIMGRIKLLEGPVLKPGQSGFAQVRLEKPVFALPGDHFIIRKYSPVITIGGGKIIRNIPPKHRRISPELIETLSKMESIEPGPYLAVLIRESGVAGQALNELTRATGLSKETLRQTLDALAQEKEIHLVKGTALKALSTAVVDETGKNMTDLLEKFHGKSPLKKGMGREEFRTKVCENADPDIFKYLLDHFSAVGMIRVSGELVALSSFQITLSRDEQGIKDRIESLYRQAGLAPPESGDIFAKSGADTPTAEKMLQLLLQEKRLIRIGTGLVFHHQVLENLVNRLRSLKEDERRFGVPEFKKLTSVTRKYAIPLLEYLDRERVTRRIGNERIVI